MQAQSFRYYPQYFDRQSMLDAASCALGHHSQPLEDRWQKETPYVVARILEHRHLNESSLVIDYGCGIGRVAKELIARTNCRVLGVDISLAMLKFALEYVASPNFAAVPANVFRKLDLKADYIVSCWVIQHSADPLQDVELISSHLRSDGGFFCLNEHRRLIPDEGRVFVDDEISVQQLVANRFQQNRLETLPADVASAEIREASWWGLFSSQ
jgi:SAM-dependent methyltransferase